MVSRSAEGDNAAEFLRGSSSDTPGGGDLRGGWNHWMELWAGESTSEC